MKKELNIRRMYEDILRTNEEYTNRNFAYKEEAFLSTRIYVPLQVSYGTEHLFKMEKNMSEVGDAELVRGSRGNSPRTERGGAEKAGVIRSY